MSSEFTDINEEEETDDECVYVDNVVDELVAFYERKKTQEDFSISNDIVFYSIVKYFENNFMQESQRFNRGLDGSYFIFIIPNEWQLKPDIIDYVMVPLLENMGVSLPQDRSQRVLFITWLESKLLFFQQTTPNLLKNDDRCIWHDIHVNERAVTIKTAYFQVKEDYNLKFNRSFFVPKIKSLDDYQVFHEFNLKNYLEELTFTSMMDASHLINTPYPDNQTLNYGNVTDYILDMILVNIEARIQVKVIGIVYTDGYLGILS